MRVLCLDLEGVLIPEIWQAVATKTGVVVLGKTTRDIPVYDDLMSMRLTALREAQIPYQTIADVIATVEPLPGALDFLGWARERFQVAILSDTFYEFGMPMMRALGYPMLLCHRLHIADGFITGYQLRQQDPKRQSVKAFQGLGYEVLAAGDSFNDISMLEQSDAGAFLHSPDNVALAHPQYPRCANYAELREWLEASDFAER
ncbi:MAG: bifunctional phosphoserine phosphatase/homoserine phosphotransferase ThrH [Pseudomonadota bacterium]